MHIWFGGSLVLLAADAHEFIAMWARGGRRALYDVVYETDGERPIFLVNLLW